MLSANEKTADIKVNTEPDTRFHLLDTLRGFLIICVVVFHFVFDLAEIGVPGFYDWLPHTNPIMGALQLIGVLLFVLISGICSRLSRNNLKRGAIALAFALLVSLVTYFFTPQFFIFMGILHLLAVCMIVSHFILMIKPKNSPEKLSLWPAISALGLLVLFALTYRIKDPAYGVGIAGANIPLEGFPLYGTLPGYILGFGGFVGVGSADYYPIFPWIFAFFAGMCLGGYFKRGQVPKIFSTLRIKPLAAAGKHSLIIYILHQPVLYGITMLLAKLI